MAQQLQLQAAIAECYFISLHAPNHLLSA